MKKLLCLLLAGPLLIFAACTGVQWSPLGPIDLFNVAGQNGILPNVAISENGDMVAAWVNSTAGPGGVPVVQARYRPVGQNWQPTQIISSGNAVSYNNPAVAIDQNGNAVVAWFEFGSSSFYIVQAAVRAGGSASEWVKPTGVPLNAASTNGGDVVAAWDNNSNAVIGWSLFGGVFQSTSMNLQGSTTAVVTLSAAGENTSAAHMVANANGDIVVVWINASPGGGRMLEASFKLNGQAWQATPDVITGAGTIPLYPSIAMDIHRDAVVLWSTANGPLNMVVRSAQKLFGARSWDLSAAPLTSTAFNPSLAQVGVDKNGNATAIWNQNGSAPANNPVVMVATKSLTSTTTANWTEGPVLSQSALIAEGCIDLGVDSMNDVVAIWAYDSTNTYSGAIASESSPFCFSPNWITPEVTLSASDASSPGSCSLSITPNGQVVAIWTKTNLTTSNTVVQSLTGYFSLLPPSNLSAQLLNNDFALISEFYYILKWVDSPSPGVAGYHIYLNGSLIASVGPSATQYEQHNQVKGQSVTFTVTAYNAAGQESSGATVSLE